MKHGICEFWGFYREDGRVGSRNHVLILPVAPSANRAAGLARQEVPGAVGIELQQDIGPDILGWDLAVRTYAGWVDHPNVFATVLVGLTPDDPLLAAITRTIPARVRYRVVTLEEEGGTLKAASAIQRIVRAWVEESRLQKRQPAPLSKLLLATECGGSDACSGLSANPSLGYASDLIVQAGGSSILAETTELIGAEGILVNRAVSPDVGQQLLATVRHAEYASMRMGVDFRGAQPAPGNIEGGITTIEEKSLGCVHKGGLSPLVEVVDYASRPTAPGLIMMDTPGHDVMQLVGMAASGAQVIVFTTGRGTPTGSAIVPVIKMSTRSALQKKLPDVIDIDAGPVIDGHLTVEAMGTMLFRKIISVVEGETVWAERSGHREFGIFQGWGSDEV